MGEPNTAFVRINASVTILQSQKHVLSSFSDSKDTLSYDSVGRHRAGLVKVCSNAALGALCHPVLIGQHWCRCVLAPCSLKVRRCGRCASQAFVLISAGSWRGLRLPRASVGVPFSVDMRSTPLHVTLTGVRLLCRRHAPSFRGHMPGLSWCSRYLSTCAALCFLLVCLHMPLGQAVTPLTDWTTGIATNYGGPLDGKNPYDPSWGTITV